MLRRIADRLTPRRGAMGNVGTPASPSLLNDLLAAEDVQRRAAGFEERRACRRVLQPPLRAAGLWGKVDDISSGGICLSLATPLSPGRRHQIVLTDTLLDYSQEVTAEVMWYADQRAGLRWIGLWKDQEHWLRASVDAWMDAEGDRLRVAAADQAATADDPLNLVGADLRGAQLRATGMAGADLRGAHLDAADLRQADLRQADLRNAYLCWAQLDGAQLRQTKLQDADLRGVALRSADLRRANLCGAALNGAKLGGVHLAGATFDLSTQWPDGFDARAHGAKLVLRRSLPTALRD